MAYRKTSGRPGSTRMAMSATADAQEADDLLKSIGQRVVSMLQAGGDKARQFDDAYSAKVMEAFGVNDESVRSPLRKMVGATIGSPLGHGMIKNVELNANPNFAEKALAAAVPYAVPAVSAGVRYGVPLAAAAGLSELTGDMYDYATQQPMI